MPIKTKFLGVVRKTLSAIGAFLAPFFFALGRVTCSLRVIRFSLELDGTYSRSYRFLADKNNGGSVEFEHLFLAAKMTALARRSVGEEVMQLIGHHHSQRLQDVLCVLIHEGMRDGYFLEIGVGDGTTLSNTAMLERDFGWSGLLVEPAKQFQNAIRTNRRAQLDERAVGVVTGEMCRFFENLEFGEFSGIVEQSANKRGRAIEEYMVETVTLNDLLEQHNSPFRINFLSLDVEGNELDILRSFSFAKYSVDIITVEHNFESGKLSALDQLLVPHGYTRILSQLSLFDAWYIHERMKDTTFS